MQRINVTPLLGLFSLVLLSLITGCSTAPERHPLPAEFVNVATIDGIPNAWFWGDEWSEHSLAKISSYTEDEIRQRYAAIHDTSHNYLAISGGGPNGAFGAGLMAGWTEAGDRPEFTMVTGISTGALSAPFVFLGPDYDDALKALYTTTSTKDIVKERNLFEASFGDSVADTSPLRSLIESHITQDIINAIGREHQRGRRLWIGTLNLDAERSVIWDIGAIATSDSPHKISLIHDVLQASAAIPVAFPPVVIQVTADGRDYDEMHVDGGTGSQVFVYPAAVDWTQITGKLKVQGKPGVYVIRNAFMDPEYKENKRSILAIATRSIDSLIRTQGIGDLYQIHDLCERDGNDFNLAIIPSTFTEKPAEGFDPVYMTKLYELGFEMAAKGYPWMKTPPYYLHD